MLGWRCDPREIVLSLMTGGRSALLLASQARHLWAVAMLGTEVALSYPEWVLHRSGNRSRLRRRGLGLGEALMSL